MDSFKEEFSCTIPEIASTAKEVNILPEKSKKKYEKQYEQFVLWCKKKNVGKYTENVMMAYFSERAETMKSSTLWSTYSMLRSVLSMKNEADISKYKKLIAYLKRKSIGYKANKSKTFTGDEIVKFLREAPNEVYLLKKVVLIMGIFGSCRRNELVKMAFSDVEDKGSLLLVKLPDAKTHQSRFFTVTNNYGDLIDFLSFYRQYIAFRPLDDDTPPRLFLRYFNGKCTKQVVGMNVIGNVPNEIARYLKLPDTKMYTGHSFRRTSATFLRYNNGGWKRSTVPEVNVKQNIKKVETPHNIMGSSMTVQLDTLADEPDYILPDHGVDFENYLDENTESDLSNGIQNVNRSIKGGQIKLEREDEDISDEIMPFEFCSPGMLRGSTSEKSSVTTEQASESDSRIPIKVENTDMIKNVHQQLLREVTISNDIAKENRMLLQQQLVVLQNMGETFKALLEVIKSDKKD